MNIETLYLHFERPSYGGRLPFYSSTLEAKNIQPLKKSNGNGYHWHSQGTTDIVTRNELKRCFYHKSNISLSAMTKYPVGL